MASSTAASPTASLSSGQDQVVFDIASNGLSASGKPIELTIGDWKGSKQHIIRRRRKPSDESLLHSIRAWLVQHQLGMLFIDGYLS